LALLCCPSAPIAQTSPTSPQSVESRPGSINLRLILYDGTYQRVRDFRIQANKVVYLSIERNQWEDLPLELIDWQATRKWAAQHGQTIATPANSQQDPSNLNNQRPDTPGLREAAELDRERQAERDDQAARRPEIAPGLHLPDLDAMFVVDIYRDQPQAINLKQAANNTTRTTQRRIEKLNLANPANRRQFIQLDHTRALVRLHRNDPVFYLSLPDPPNATAPDNAMLVNTHGASAAIPDAPTPEHSRFLVVRLEERVDERRIPPSLLNSISINATNATNQAESRWWPLNSTIIKGNHWMRLELSTTLDRGEYAVLELLDDHNANRLLWDFAIDPVAPENQDPIVGHRRN
jgi:hypothetical protein